MTAVDVRNADQPSCEPAPLPDDLVSFNQEIEGSLPVGAPGKVGALSLSLTSDGPRTRVERQFQRAPLHVYRPVYLDDGRPGMAYIYLQQFGDGLVQGDRHRVDIRCGPGSEVHVTTQAATKVFSAPQNLASQVIKLYADDGAFLEYLPDPVVPFRGSRFFQRTVVTAHPGSTVILGETLLPGRIAYGERHVYDLFWSETEVHDQTGGILVKDLLRLQPDAGESPHSLAVLGPCDVIASFYVITGRTSPATMTEVLRSALAECPEVLCGVSRLPNDSGVGVRILGSTSMAVKAATTRVWSAARFQLVGTPVPDLRKG